MDKFKKAYCKISVFFAVAAMVISIVLLCWQNVYATGTENNPPLDYDEAVNDIDVPSVDDIEDPEDQRGQVTGSATSDSTNGFTVSYIWDAYEDAVISIIQPVTWEEAEILITCCPTDRMAGIEWSLLHCIESCIPGSDFEKNPQVMEKYKNLINTCNSDMMKEMLYMRLGSQ